MEVLQNGATDLFVFGTDILCIVRSDFGSNEKVVALSNFSGEGQIIDLESMFSSLSISFCNSDRRLLGRAEKRGRISFMRTSKEIHISF